MHLPKPYLPTSWALTMLCFTTLSFAAPRIEAVDLDAKAAQQRLTQIVSALEEKGVSLDVAHYAPAPIPEEQNGAVELWEAVQKLRVINKDHEDAIYSYGCDKWPDTQQQQAISGYVQACGNVFPLIDAAEAKGKANWGQVLPKGQSAVEGTRLLSMLLGRAAIDAASKRDEALIARRLQQIIFLAAAVRQRGDYNAELSATGAEFCAAADALLILAQIKPSKKELRAELVHLQELLADDAASHHQFCNARWAECAAQLKMARRAAEGQDPDADDGAPAKPYPEGAKPRLRAIFLSNACDLIPYQEAVLAATASPTWPTCSANMPELSHELLTDARRYPATATLAHMIPHSAKSYYLNMARRHMVAAAIATHLYAADHGKLPTALQDLVPQYLPAVPLDPMAPDKQVLCYHPGEDPVIYSRGENGLDDSGNSVQDPKVHSVQKLDIVLHLATGLCDW